MTYEGEARPYVAPPKPAYPALWISSFWKLIFYDQYTWSLLLFSHTYHGQGCIIRSILPSGMGARGVSSEHVENMEMFSGSPLRCSPVLQLRCSLVFGEMCSDSRRTVLWFSEYRALEGSGVCTIVTRHASINQMTQKSREDFWRRKASLHLLMFK